MLTGYYAPKPGGETIFSVDPRPIKFGPGAIREIGSDAKALGMSRVAVFTDKSVLNLVPTQDALRSLTASGITYAVYDDTLIEPTDQSFMAACEFVRADGFDGIVSIGGGSVIDTAKAANLLVTHPTDLLTFVNKPIGAGRPVPGPLVPHIACPTTSGTGSESTGVAVFDLLSQQLKTGISSKFLKPSLGVIDPEFTYTLPPLVTAATAFDVLTHAIESYTAIPFTQRQPPAEPSLRPPYQGANPHSDLGSLEAIRLGGKYLVRAVKDEGDHEARNAMMYAATMAGISFGNAGVHIPHAMSYSVAGMIRDYMPEGWPKHHSLCPHGISVVVNAPAAFRFTGPAAPARHLEAAQALGADIQDVPSEQAGDVLASKLIALMRKTGIPNGLQDLNYSEKDIAALASGAYQQQRLLTIAPRTVSEEHLVALYQDAMRYWD
jgi:alcohol dehydrogenase class IV